MALHKNFNRCHFQSMRRCLKATNANSNLSYLLTCVYRNMGTITGQIDESKHNYKLHKIWFCNPTSYAITKKKYCETNSKFKLVEKCRSVIIVRCIHRNKALINSR